MYGPNFFPYPGYNLMSAAAPARGGLGLLRRLGTSGGFFRNINWGSLFSNTSRALGVVNQAIPIVKQAGPMFHNMRSMLKVASVFKDVTDSDTRKSNNNNQKKDTSNTSNSNNNYNNNYPSNNTNNQYSNNYNTNYSTNNNQLPNNYNTNYPPNNQIPDNYNYSYYNSPNFFI